MELQVVKLKDKLMRQQGDVNKAPAVKCLAHGGEQDGQVGTQAPTGEEFNNYFVICLVADSHNRQGQEQKLLLFWSLAGYRL